MTNPGPGAVDILSVRVNCVTMEQTLGILQSMIERGTPHHVVTVNPEFIMTALAHEPFREVLNASDLAIPDGVGIVLASRLLGRPIRERVTGVDLVERFASLAAARGFRIFLLGAAPGVAERAAEVLIRANIGLVIAGTYGGSPHPREEEDICRRIEAARPDVLLVAYGSPKQDLWIARTRARLRIPVSIGIGGSLDYIAGVVTRAPGWAQSTGLEWLYRLSSQPERWRRMLALPKFAFRVIGQYVQREGDRAGRGVGVRPAEASRET